MVVANQKRHKRLGGLKISVHDDRKAAGSAAAEDVAGALKDAGASSETGGVIFATGASQLETLRALVRIKEVPWHKIRGFHMDDYMNLPDDHPASFLRYLQANLCPATILSTHHDTTLYLDEEAAVEIGDLLTSSEG